ncbi:ubiquitin-like small modifier protein 1 [Natrarchaeobaculum aegyptiacum]|uniref:Molybdopterin synthase sulfur carrier subunit n=1 Tax=Natrarchaeobaculum aegyptiacum TaxID=745377 RepID=A0A2Z2I2I3_9EURY|nr:ubiquitin-like small modifier protein 1 [Natrarchaeobaculum aegyptiacum]ARS91078.1 hypothetical protein B1756_15955 [Natrarchaeobaculum aegyptiacum]
MSVTCDFYGPLREAVDQKTLTRDPPTDGTVGTFLESLAADYPELDDLLFEDGDLQSTANVSVNARHLRLEEGLETPLEAGDRVRLYPPIEGGRL